MENENNNLTENAELEIDNGAFEDAWEDSEEITGLDAEQAEAETDQSEAEAGGTEQNSESGADNTEGFTLRYMQEDKKYSKDDTIALAQKGLDYDRIRTERDSMKGEMPALHEMRDFLEELAKDSDVTVEQLIEDVRTQRLIRRESDAGRTISDTGAREQIKREKAARGAKAEQTDKDKGGNAEKDKGGMRNMDAEVREFCKSYPDVIAKDIPQSVWDSVKSGVNLTVAYTKHENSRLKDELTKLKSTERNRGRSAGSRQTSGAGTSKSAFDLAWDDTD